MKHLVRRIEVWSRPSQNHNYSLTKLALQKGRVLLEYFVVTFVDWRSLRKSHKITAEMKDTKKHMKALVIAGGPSSACLDLNKISRLQGAGLLEVISMNWFTHSPLAKHLTPDFYVLSDPINRYGSGQEFKGRKCDEVWEKLHSWPHTELIVPHNWYTDTLKIPNKIAMYFDDRQLLGFSRNISLTKPRGYSSMTAHKAIAAAIYLGYSQIFVSGLDGTMFKAVGADRQNNLSELPNNAADMSSTPPQPISHHYPNGIADFLFNHSMDFAGLRKCFADQKIINLNSHSLVDAFEKAHNHYLLLASASMT